jgi:hypothetical protein
MKNPAIIQIIKERFQEQKINAKYQLQLTKIVEMEYNFTKEFSKEKWKEYFDLSLELGCLHDIETDQLLDFTIELIKEIKL